MKVLSPDQNFKISQYLTNISFDLLEKLKVIKSERDSTS